MNMMELYRSFLDAVDLPVTDSGHVAIRAGGDTFPFTIGGKTLVLPTKDNLVKPKDSIVVFHPLQEALPRGESEVLTAVRRVAASMINAKFGAMFATLLQIATSPAEHKRLTPVQNEFLVQTGLVDETTLANFMSIMSKAQADDISSLFISIHLNRGGHLDRDNKKIRCARVCCITFPFLDQLYSTEEKIGGVRIRVKDRKAYINLFKYLIPQTDVDGYYNFGCDSKTAPYFEALCGGLNNIATVINDDHAMFEQILPDSILINTDWAAPMLEAYKFSNEISLIPMQAGNEGAAAQVQGTTVASESRPTTTVTPVAPPGRRPVVNTPPQPEPAQGIPPARRAPTGPVVGHTPEPGEKADVAEFFRGLRSNRYPQNEPVRTPQRSDYGRPREPQPGAFTSALAPTTGYAATGSARPSRETVNWQGNTRGGGGRRGGSGGGI